MIRKVTDERENKNTKRVERRERKGKKRASGRKVWERKREYLWFRNANKERNKKNQKGGRDYDGGAG
jgi:hypothetical protein